jgi:outer membrane protein
MHFPRLDGVAEATYANPNQRIFPQSEQFRATWSAGVVLSWSPNEALAGGQGVRCAEAKEAETRAQLSALRDQLRGEVVSSYHAVEEARASLVSTRRGVAASEEGHRVRLALYQAGRATGTELTDAENDLTRARFGLVNAYIDARLARVRLVHAIGRD